MPKSNFAKQMKPAPKSNFKKPEQKKHAIKKVYDSITEGVSNLMNNVQN
jgi:hypothetical protein